MSGTRSNQHSNREMMRDKVFLEMAVVLGQLGTCSRAHVGCIITRDHRAISWGYNGAPPGAPHCNENNHGWGEDYHKPYAVCSAEHKTGYMMDPPERCWCGARIEYITQEEGCRNATHAEANALAFAARQGISTDGGTLYVERSPCDTCARLCVAAGIARVVYLTAYRNESPITLLRSAGVEVECIV